MKSANLVQIGKIVIDEHCPEPKLTSPEQTLVRVRYAAINADDYSAFAGYLGRVYNSQRLLHEFSGEIVALGPQAAAQGFAVGDHVSCNILRGCGVCPACRRGRTNLCSERSAAGGASSEYIVVNAENLVHLPDEIPLEQGALYWLVSTCTACVERIAIQPGSRVLVLGGGAAGLMLLQLLKKKMPSILAVSEPVAAKRALARSLGADLVIDPATERIEELILMYSDGQGFDAVIDAAGELTAIENAVGLLARGGTLMLFSNYKVNDALRLSLMELYWKQITILTSFGIDTSNYTADSANILRHLNIACLIDQILPLDEFQHAMQLYGSRQCLRILLKI